MDIFLRLQLAIFSQVRYIKSMGKGRMAKQRMINVFVTYTFAVLIAFLALLIKLLLDPYLGTLSFILVFLPAIILSAWYGGLATGIVTSFLAALEIDYFLLLHIIRSRASNSTHYYN